MDYAPLQSSVTADQGGGSAMAASGKAPATSKAVRTAPMGRRAVIILRDMDWLCPIALDDGHVRIAAEAGRLRHRDLAMLSVEPRAERACLKRNKARQF